MTEVALDESPYEIHTDQLTRDHADTLHSFLKERTQALLAGHEAGTEPYRALLALDTAVDMTYDNITGYFRYLTDLDRDLAELRENWQRLRWFSFPWRGTPGYDDALWPRAKYGPLRANGAAEGDAEKKMLQAAERASAIRQKALAQLAAIRRVDGMPTDPEDEVIAHRMLEAYFQHYEQIAAERDAPAIGREIGDQRRAWSERQQLTGHGPTWLLKFATEGELNAIVKSLQDEETDEEITRATFERAAVKRWLTAQGHDINEDDVQPL
ncbi:hypothetical protein [Streptomyces clavuligerus]|uniref:Uncharacterized protein n=1 Tax=Streptomyces clavuligerus TaxID=1901 RepID=Q6TMU2_STRCL|nr:hypothetical protein [Streptomyces clavuligerus]AAQ93531.1 hypothetical protein pSCL2.3.73.9 [Streptomyces clavuligerus]AXU16828.1 hypothetical protein D1794_29110 [Streptomyces clavuligerus]EDY48760.1 conserved hypothetical protein [Streptomyces clavuligerus]MBY6300963.1 hypothetical protein [Streptomyces clavuligerus]QPJ97026.1 hypothetical protein GE265_28345 [Streptomyces clavuligerus]